MSSDGYAPSPSLTGDTVFGEREREREREGGGKRRKAVLTVSEPTCPSLCCRSAGCLAISEPTCRAPCYRGAGCISGVGTYLPGTVLQ